MNTREALAFVQRLADHFPFWGDRLTPERIANLAQDWTLIMGDLDQRIVAAAIAQLISEPRQFPPSVGDVNTAARALMGRVAGDAPEMDAGEAWRRVCQAVTGFGNGAAWDAERRASLPPAAVRAAEDFGLMRIRMRLEENAGTDFAQFRGIYEAHARRDAQQRNTPPAVTAAIESVAARLKLGAPRKESTN